MTILKGLYMGYWFQRCMEDEVFKGGEGSDWNWNWEGIKERVGRKRMKYWREGKSKEGRKKFCEGKSKEGRKEFCEGKSKEGRKEFCEGKYSTYKEARTIGIGRICL